MVYGITLGDRVLHVCVPKCHGHVQYTVVAKWNHLTPHLPLSLPPLAFLCFYPHVPNYFHSHFVGLFIYTSSLHVVSSLSP